MKNAKTILIADPSPLYRFGIRQLFPDYQRRARIYEAANNTAVLELARQAERLDLIVLDAALLTADKHFLLRSILADRRVPVVLLCNTHSVEMVSQAHGLGITHVIEKTMPISDIQDTIQEILAGRWRRSTTPCISPDRPSPRKRLTTLTYKQKVVLDHLKGGLMNKEIAFRMGIHENTVKTHVTNILSKMQVNTRTQLVISLRHRPW